MPHDDPTTEGEKAPPVHDGPVGDGPEPRRRRSTVRRALAALGIAAVLGVVAWYTLIPYPWTLRTTNPQRTSLMEQRIEAALAEGDTLEIDQRWVPLEEISDNLVRAVIVAEDYRFRLHHGIDWVSLAEEVQWTGSDTLSWTRASDLAALVDAAHYVWTNRAELRGRSTLTQQLAKNLYYGTDRSLARKVLEYVVAGRLERRLDKDRILELYLNVVEWGPGIFGAEAAAQTYFGRSASALTLEQAAALAGTLPHPLTSNPAHAPGRMAWRQELILDRLDPSRGLPDTPMPLPSPDIRRDFDAGIPAPRVLSIDTGGSGAVVVPIDTMGSAGVVVPIDTIGSGGVVVPIDTIGR